jgi:hypothetical protein
MYSKIIGSTLVVASMLGAPVIAFAGGEGETRMKQDRPGADTPGQ